MLNSKYLGILSPSVGVLKWCVSSCLKNGIIKSEKITLIKIAEEIFFISEWSKESAVTTWRSEHLKQAVSPWFKEWIWWPKAPVRSVFTGISNKTLTPLFKEQEDKRTNNSRAVAKICLKIKSFLWVFIFFTKGKYREIVWRKKLGKHF